MLDQWMPYFNAVAAHLQMVVFILMVLLHLILAAGVAKDINHFHKRRLDTQLVSGMVWVLATLLGGVWVLLIYWLIHHSSLSK